MNTLSAAINASLNLDELLEIIVYSLSQLIECDRVAVFLMDNERGLLSLAKSRGLSTDFIRWNQNIRPELGGQAQVVLDRYPLVVGDTRQMESSAAFASLIEREGIAAFVDLPLRGREHVLGALTVYYDRPHSFDESELELLRSIVNQVTLAVENARLYERTDQALARRVDQLAAIEEIGRELTSTFDLNRVFNLVLQRAMGSTGASAGLLAVCDTNCDELELIVDRGYPPGKLDRYRTEGWSSTHGIFGRVARAGETAVVNDVHADPDYVPHLETTCAQLVVPIVKETRVLGIASLESSRSQGFSPDDVRFTTQLAELAAIAIDNARLFQQVREGRDNLQAILDSTREGVLVIGRDKRIALANPMIEEMSGLSAQKLVGQPVSRLMTGQDPRVATLLGYLANGPEKALGLLDATSAKVTKRTLEIPGPPSRHIEQVASPIMDKDGGVVGRLIVFRDVTEEHRLATMRQDLTDMIIHDLRSPLTAVIGGVQLASDLTKASGDPEAIQRALDTADQSCDRLMSLVDSLLDISRLEAGQMPLQRQPVLLPKLAQSVIQQMQPLAEQQTVTLELKTDAQTPPIDADHELISRVLVNLIDNALKHSPPNSTVTVKIAPEFSDPQQEKPDTGTDAVGVDGQAGPVVRCTVLDSGPGIPLEYRKRVFERFAQLGGRRRGKGLGLAFCQLAVQAHGGRIWVDDNPTAQGSAFHFTLPVVLAELLSVFPDSSGQASR
jgi:NtrC-family two-component system sensor histidine kinase KinB